MSTSSNNGKGVGKQFFKKKTPKKHPPKQKTYEVTFKQPKVVLSGATLGGENVHVSNPVLSGKVPETEGTYNRFSCFAVNSKLAHSTNTKSKPMEGLYTDTDPDNRSEIITDVTIRVPGKAGTMIMEVKVDPGVQPSYTPLHKFKTLFPHLCRVGLLRQGLLENTQSKFQSYNGADMMCYGYLLIDVNQHVNHVTCFTDSAGPVGGAVAGGDQEEIIVLADIHRENVDEEGMSMSFQVTWYNQM